MMMALAVMWFAAEPNLQPDIRPAVDVLLLLASVLVIGLVFFTGWAVATIWVKGTSVWRAVAALFLTPVVAISAGVGWYYVMFDLIAPLINSPWALLLWLGFIVMPIVAVGGFIWLFRRVGRKPSGGQGSEVGEPDV